MRFLQEVIRKTIVGLEVRRKAKQCIARGNINFVGIERDAAQTAVATLIIIPRPVDVRVGPVNNLPTCLFFQVQQEKPAVALTTVGFAIDCADEKPGYWFPNPLRRVSQ